MLFLDCLEHIPTPNAAMRKVAKWLRPYGFVFIRGPLSNSRLAHLKEALRRSLHHVKKLPGYPLDANVFNKKSLAVLLSKTGFVIQRWYNETPSFANLLGRRID